MQVLLGNHVAEDRVYEPVVCHVPTESASSQELESKIGDCLPAYVVTRAMKKMFAQGEAKETESLMENPTTGGSRHTSGSSGLQNSQDAVKNNSALCDEDLSDTFFTKMFQAHQSMPTSASVNSNTLESMITAQGKDPEAKKLFSQVVPTGEVDRAPVCFFVRDDLLLRKWRSPIARADDIPTCS